MNTRDRERFLANVTWFNQFFDDIRQLMEEISNTLLGKFNLRTSNSKWYYVKSQYQPAIPPYYVTALANNRYVVQVYTIFDPSLLQGQPEFEKMPSLILVKHSRTDRVLWMDNYGLRVIKNQGISQTRIGDRIISGEILEGEGRGTKYFAFQVDLGEFSTGKDIHAVIENKIVDTLATSPDWGGKNR